MRVKDIMNRHVRACHAGASLSDAAQVMWDCDCGVAPVVDDAGHVMGVITDRDICMAAYIKNQRLQEIPVAGIISKTCITCTAEDEVPAALSAMKEHQIRRLPVVSPAGKLVGILSLNDIVLTAKKSANRRNGVKYEDVADTLSAISRHRGALEPVAV